MSARIGLGIKTRSGLEIEPGVDRVTPQGLELGLLRLPSVLAFDLRLQPQLVDVAAVPAFGVQIVAVAPSPGARL
jgi:hypothetical protein